MGDLSECLRQDRNKWDIPCCCRGFSRCVYPYPVPVNVPEVPDFYYIIFEVNVPGNIQGECFTIPQPGEQHRHGDRADPVFRVQDQFPFFRCDLSVRACRSLVWGCLFRACRIDGNKPVFYRCIEHGGDNIPEVMNVAFRCLPEPLRVYPFDVGRADVRKVLLADVFADYIYEILIP